jgi:hypothetical protein
MEALVVGGPALGPGAEGFGDGIEKGRGAPVERAAHEVGPSVYMVSWVCVWFQRKGSMGRLVGRVGSVVWNEREGGHGTWRSVWVRVRVEEWERMFRYDGDGGKRVNGNVGRTVWSTAGRYLSLP